MNCIIVWCSQDNIFWIHLWMVVWTHLCIQCGLGFGFYCVVGKANFVVLTMHALTCLRGSWIWHHLPKIYLPTKHNFFLVFLHPSLGLVSMWPTMPTIILVNISSNHFNLYIRTCKRYQGLYLYFPHLNTKELIPQTIILFFFFFLDCPIAQLRCI